MDMNQNNYVQTEIKITVPRIFGLTLFHCGLFVRLSQAREWVCVSVCVCVEGKFFFFFFFSFFFFGGGSGDYMA